MVMLEIGLAVVTLIVGVIGFFIRRLFGTVDNNTEEIMLVRKESGREIQHLRKELSDHRVMDASTFISRPEFDSRLIELKNDIRGMISPLHHKIDNIESYVREVSKRKD